MTELALKEELSKLKALLALVLRKASVLDARSNSDPVVPVEDMRFVQSTNNIISENKFVDDLKQTIQRLQTEKENSIQQVPLCIWNMTTNNLDLIYYIYIYIYI